jgi:hypothetical protein
VTQPPAPKKKRRRWIGVVIAVVVLVILLVVGYVRDRIIEVLKLDPASEVDVDLGGGSVLLQAARGALDEVNVQAEQVTFGDITGSARITATTVPLDSSKPVDQLGIVVTVSEANVQKLSSFMSGIDLKSIELKDELIRITTEFNLFLFVIPVSLDLEPSAKDGGISFDPVTVILGEEEISVEDLRRSAEFRALAGDLLNSRDFCVAGYLPRALTIDDVDVVGSNLVISIEGDGTALSDPALSALGTCPS